MNRRAFALGLALGAAVGLEGQTPRPSPEFTFSLADGRRISLSQYRGKTVALAFLSTT